MRRLGYHLYICGDIYYAKYYGKGEGGWSAGGKKLKLGVRGKKWKGGKKKGGKLHYKEGKGLKNASFGL